MLGELYYLRSVGQNARCGLQQHYEEPASGFTSGGFFFFISIWLDILHCFSVLPVRGGGVQENQPRKNQSGFKTRFPLYVCSFIPVFSGRIANSLLIPQNSVQLWPMLSLDWPHVGEVQGAVGWNPALNSEGREGSSVRKVQGRGGLWGAAGLGGVVASLRGRLGFR